MEGTIGEIRLFTGNFAPLGWALCDGSSVNISIYTAAYAIIGDTFGGDGQTYFNLPDFRSRIAVGTGSGGGLTQRYLGEMGGTETVSMTTAQMPAHIHPGKATIAIPALSTAGNQATANGNNLAALAGAYTTEDTDVTLAKISISPTLSTTGSGTPFSILEPAMALNYVICLEGIFPSRN